MKRRLSLLEELELIFFAGPVTIAVAACAIFLLLSLASTILFPHRGSRENARRASCQSNLRFIAMGVKQYLRDYDDKYPIAKNSKSGPYVSDNWRGLLEPYIEDPKVFQCSSDKDATTSKFFSYGYNSKLNVINKKSIRSPTVCITFFEVIADPNGWTQTGTAPQAVSASTRHLEGANYSFVDGHIKWLKPEKVTALPPSKAQFTFVPG